MILTAEYVRLDKEGRIEAQGSLTGLPLRRALPIIRRWRREGYFVKVGW